MTVEGQDLVEHLREKYGSTKAYLGQTTKMITERGSALNFEFNFKENGRIYNTFNAHRLLLWAKQFNKQTELKLALFALYFTEGGNPKDQEALMRVVNKTGLPVEIARKILESDQFAKEVREEQLMSTNMGITSVPTFIINKKYKITGGQPVAVFVDTLKKIVAEEIAT